MKRIGKILLVPATTITKGRAYVGCLHGDTNINKRTFLVACEGEEEDPETEAFSCRFENGNTYPYMKKELFNFFFEYDVPSLANPRKTIGQNQTPIADADYDHIIQNQIGSMCDVETRIDFDSNTAKLLTKEVGFSLTEVISILESMKNNDSGALSSMSEYICNTAMDETIDKKIVELKKKYNG